MENNQLQIVSFEQAQRLKKLGFDWECDSCYWEDGEVDYHGNNNWNNVHPFSGIDEEIFSAPPVALALKWFRDKKINSYVAYDNGWQGFYAFGKASFDETGCFNTYDEAEIALLELLLSDFKPKL